MIINGATIVGAKITTKDTKKTVGHVTDIVLSQKKKKIAAFILSHGLSGKAVRFGDAASVGEDEIVITSEKVLKDAEKMVTKSSEKNFVAQTDVVTQKGEEMGKMKDVFFDTQSGKVMEMEVTPQDEPQKDATLLIKIKDIVSMGDVIVVKQQNTSTQPSQSEGVLDKTKKAAKNAYEQTKLAVESHS